VIDRTERTLAKNSTQLTRYSTFTTFIFCAIAALINATPAHALVGAIPGEANVQPSGTSSYTIPIRVTPGITGLQPQDIKNMSSPAA